MPDHCSDNHYYDSHCHFDFSEFDDVRHALWQQCHDVGIRRLMIPGVSPSQWQVAEAMVSKYQSAEHFPIVMGAGLHPWWVSQAGLPERDRWLATLAKPYCRAVGECGLDGVIETPLSQQLPIFEQHLQVAKECSMPLIIHVRQAHNEMIRCLKRYGFSQSSSSASGVIHGFTGSLELAKEYWNMGFYLGVGGSITYPRAKKTQATIKAMPLESLLLETDAPDMPVYGHQGKANSPVHIVTIAETLAELKECRVETVAEQTMQNGLQLFGL